MEDSTANTSEVNVKLRKEIKHLSNNLLFQSIALALMLITALFMSFKYSPIWIIISVFLVYDFAEALGKYINIYKEIRVLNEIKKIIENIPWAQVKGREGEIEQALNFINYRIDNGQSSKDALDRFRKDVESIINRS